MASSKECVVIETGEQVQPQGAPGAGGQLAHEPSVVAEKHPQALRDSKDHLAVGDVLEEFVLRPVGPQDLALGMAAWTQAANFAGESDEEVEAAFPAAGASDAAVQVPVDDLPGAGAQRSVGGRETLVVDLEVPLEVLRKRPVQHRPLRAPRPVHPGRARCCHLPSNDRRWPSAVARPA